MTRHQLDIDTRKALEKYIAGLEKRPMEFSDIEDAFLAGRAEAAEYKTRYERWMAKRDEQWEQIKADLKLPEIEGLTPILQRTYRIKLALEQVATHAGAAMTKAWKRPEGQDEDTIHNMHEIFDALSKMGWAFEFIDRAISQQIAANNAKKEQA